MGHHDKWVALMIDCMTTVSYSILISGEPSDIIRPNRGIRQGDSLSPYLFLLCIKGFHSLINQASTLGRFRGISICRSGSRPIHLYFVDDSLFFCSASVQECHYIYGLLKTYEEASRQQLNREKTTIFSAKLLTRRFKRILLKYWEYQRSNNMKNICVLLLLQFARKKPERKEFGQNSGMEREAPFSSEQGGVFESSSASYSDLFDELFQVTPNTLP